MVALIGVPLVNETPERKKAPALRAGAFVFPYGMFREGVTRG